MPMFMVIRTIAPGTMTRDQVKRFEEATQSARSVKGYRTFANLSEGKAVYILEAPSKQVLGDWLHQMEMPYKSINELELECFQGAVEADSSEVHEECDLCGNPIYYGNACLSINRNIEQVDRSDKYDGGVVTVLDSEVLVTACYECANRLNLESLKEAIRAISVRPQE